MDWKNFFERFTSEQISKLEKKLLEEYGKPEPNENRIRTIEKHIAHLRDYS